jgi:transposase
MNAVGVDIAKRTVVAFVNHKAVVVPNERKALSQWLAQLPPETEIGLESTGRYGELLARLAYERGRTVYLISPKRIKKFKDSFELRGKTDPIDAEMITLYVQERRARLHAWSPLSTDGERLRVLSRKREKLARHRQQLIAELADCPEFKAQQEMLVAQLDACLTRLQRQIKELEAQYEQTPYLLSILGVGPLTVGACLPVLEHFAFRNADAFVAYTGLDLRVKDSGQSKGRRRLTKQGDRVIRKLLYLCAMAAARTRLWRPYYERQRKKGLKRIQALVALARKLARVIYAVYHSKQMFDPAMVAGT